MTKGSTKMLVSVRTGTVDDIAAAAAIWEKAHHEHLGLIPEAAKKEHALAILASRETLPDAEFLVAELTTGLVGMLFATQARECDGTGAPIPGLLHVSYVAVDPAHWGRGIAATLLDRIVSDSLKKGYERLQLWVAANNERARTLYQRSGLTSSGREKLDDHGEKIVHYVMELGADLNMHNVAGLPCRLPKVEVTSN